MDSWDRNSYQDHDQIYQSSVQTVLAYNPILMYPVEFSHQVKSLLDWHHREW